MGQLQQETRRHDYCGYWFVSLVFGEPLEENGRDLVGDFGGL